MGQSLRPAGMSHLLQPLEKGLRQLARLGRPGDDGCWQLLGVSHQNDLGAGSQQLQGDLGGRLQCLSCLQSNHRNCSYMDGAIGVASLFKGHTKMRVWRNCSRNLVIGATTSAHASCIAASLVSVAHSEQKSVASRCDGLSSTLQTCSVCLPTCSGTSAPQQPRSPTDLEPGSLHTECSCDSSQD